MILHFCLGNQGDSTIENRLNLIQKQKKSVENQLAELAEILKVLEFKEWFYATALQDGTTENVMNMNIRRFTGAIPRD